MVLDRPSSHGDALTPPGKSSSTDSWIRQFVLALSCGLSVLLSSVAAPAEEASCFGIEVVDDVTGRGVPLVEFTTISNLRFLTDNAGRIAIAEPDLIGRKTYFSIKSHGYKVPPDGFGYRGVTLMVEPGKRATVKIKRINLAERMYRVTGSGLYRDSVLLGDATPIQQPLTNGDVVGCDSVLSTYYRGKLYWFWGDTLRPHYPIGGNFHTTAATSPLLTRKKPSIDEGIDFEYITGDDGTVRPVAQMPGDGPTWLATVTRLQRPGGPEQMYSAFIKVRNQLEAYRWGFAKWDDSTQTFVEVRSFDEKPPIALHPQSHAVHYAEEDGTVYVYFCDPYPFTRVRAEAKAFTNPGQYEGFTCLKQNTLPPQRQLDRGPDGTLRYSWKRNTPALTWQEETMFANSGLMREDERNIALRDVSTGRQVQAHSGSVSWNDNRKRWVLITVEVNGESSHLGEVWFAEADELTGPWVYAKKVVTHDKYSFYNPKQLDFFEERDDRLIYFEGTYTRTFSGNSNPTPRYDYNQVMYRLDLSLPDLVLPVAIYDRSTPDDGLSFRPNTPGHRLAFFALDRPDPGAVAIVVDGNRLRVASADEAGVIPQFFALPGDMAAPPATTLPLYEYMDNKTSNRAYSTDPDVKSPELCRAEQPLCRVWKNPREQP